MFRLVATALATVALISCTTLAPSDETLASKLEWEPGDPTPDGCVAISAAEVSTIVGSEVIETLAMQTDQPGCGYFDDEGLVLSTRFHARETGEGHFAAEVERGAEPVADIGDEAIWIARAWQLWAWQDDTLIMIGVGRIGETPERREVAIAAAESLVPRLED